MTADGVEPNASQQQGKGRLILSTHTHQYKETAPSTALSPPQAPGIGLFKLQPGPAVHCPSHPGNPETFSRDPLKPSPHRPCSHGPCTPQEGWQAVGALVTQRSELLNERQVLTGRLQSLMEEVERLSLGSSER